MEDKIIEKFLMYVFRIMSVMIVFSCSEDKTEVIIPPDPCAGHSPLRPSFTIMKNCGMIHYLLQKAYLC